MNSAYMSLVMYASACDRLSISYFYKYIWVSKTNIISKSLTYFLIDYIGNFSWITITMILKNNIYNFNCSRVVLYFIFKFGIRFEIF